MAQRFEVQLVSPREYEKAVQSDTRYSNAVDSLGFADPSKRKAYVRSTAWPELNKYLVNHEFEHLLTPENQEDADEHGVYHKKAFKQIIAPIKAPYFAPFIQKGFTGEALKDVGRNLAATVSGFAVGGPVGAVTGTIAQSLKNAANPEGSALTGRSILGAGATGGAAGFAGSQLGNFAGLGGTGATTPGLSSIGARISGNAAPQATQAARGIGQTAIQGARASTTSVPTSTLGKGISAFSVNKAPAALGQLGTQAPNWAANIGAGAGPSVASPSLLSANAAGAAAKQATLNASSKGFAGLFGGTPNIPGIPAPAGTVAAGGGGGGGGGGLGGILNKAKSYLGQAAGASAIQGGLNAFGGGGGQQPPVDYGSLAAAGGLVAAGEARGTPQVPDFNQLPSVQRFNTALTNPPTDVGRIAQTRLSEQLTAPYQGLSETETSRIRQPFEQQRTQIGRSLKEYQPGFNLSDSAYQQAIEPTLRAESQEIGYQDRLNKSQFETQRRQDIQTALGVDSQTLDGLMELAQLDVQQISIQAGIDLQMAAEFKQTMGSLAGLFVQRGLGLNNIQIGQ